MLHTTQPAQAPSESRAAGPKGQWCATVIPNGTLATPVIGIDGRTGTPPA